jgi:hypothetical protein
MIRQSVTEVCSAEASVQNSSGKLQPCQEMHKDENNVDTVPELPSKNQGACHFYIDPVATYMERSIMLSAVAFTLCSSESMGKRSSCTSHCANE